MGQLIYETKPDPKARKKYDCMACPWVFSMLSDLWGELTFTEKKAIAIARRQNESILPGQGYHKSFCKQDGEVFTFRAIPAIHEICLRLELYEE